MGHKEVMLSGQGPGLERPQASLLHPWFALAEQAVADVELLAVGEALQALRWEWSAVWWSSLATSWLYEGCPGWNAEQALFGWLQAGKDVQRALEGWQHAVYWLGERGEPQRIGFYQPLFDHALLQKQRLEQMAAQAAASAAWLSSTWGIEAMPEQAVGA